MESPLVLSILVKHWPTCLVGAVILVRACAPQILEDADLIERQTIGYARLTSPLSHLPGPEISKWTSAVYNYHYLNKRAPVYIHALHQKYGTSIPPSKNLLLITQRPNCTSRSRPCRYLRHQGREGDPQDKWPLPQDQLLPQASVRGGTQHF